MGRPADILLDITETRRSALAGEALGAPVGSPDGGPLAREHPFLAALARAGRSVIAEVKLGSPRLGDLRRRLDPTVLSRQYSRAGAAALSVVVEPDFFFGSYELLKVCVESSGLPVLAKDFIVDVVQLDRAADAGASAILLIAALHDRKSLAAYANAARARGLVPLVETHDEEDVGKLASGWWEVVGVNNRDLRTFDVDLGRSVTLAPRLPRTALRVAESGLSSSADLARLADAGFDAFLIGESLLTAGDPEAKLRQLLGDPEGVPEVDAS